MSIRVLNEWWGGTQVARETEGWGCVIVRREHGREKRRINPYSKIIRAQKLFHRMESSKCLNTPDMPQTQRSTESGDGWKPAPLFMFFLHHCLSASELRNWSHSFRKVTIKWLNLFLCDLTNFLDFGPDQILSETARPLCQDLRGLFLHLSEKTAAGIEEVRHHTISLLCHCLFFKLSTEFVVVVLVIVVS